MTRERIEDFREIVLPFLSRTLLKTNYENMGKSDAEEFTRDFNEILNLAIKALEQKPFKPMVEIDLDYVIKQTYIERDVLDKIRAEIEQRFGMHGNLSLYNKALNDVLEIIDKYKAESEET